MRDVLSDLVHEQVEPISQKYCAVCLQFQVHCNNKQGYQILLPLPTPGLDPVGRNGVLAWKTRRWRQIFCIRPACVLCYVYLRCQASGKVGEPERPSALQPVMLGLKGYGVSVSRSGLTREVLHHGGCGSFLVSDVCRNGCVKPSVAKQVPAGSESSCPSWMVSDCSERRDCWVCWP